MRKAVRSYWRWARGGSRWRLANAVLMPLLVFAVLVAIVPSTADEPQTIAGPTTPTPSTPPIPASVQARVVRIIDGDTIEVDRVLDGRATVRYTGVDTPETVAPGQPVGCFGREASDKNKQLVENKTVYLEKDVSETDHFDRLLRYVYLEDGRMVNELLVLEGYAQVSTFPPDVKYQQRFTDAQRTAREGNRGLWASCQTLPTNTPSAPVQPTTPLGGNCHPSYPDVCIAPPPPDLDCPDIPFKRIRISGPDVHQLDGSTNNGIGCET